jgi:hypothetical protein
VSSSSNGDVVREVVSKVTRDVRADRRVGGVHVSAAACDVS